jgi:hypothetical protein
MNQEGLLLLELSSATKQAWSNSFDNRSISDCPNGPENKHYGLDEKG